jgi:prophage antirepressor-like protein
MTNITLFDFENNNIRFVGTAESPEWIAADICKALDLEDTSKACSTLELDEKSTTNVPDGSLTGSQMLTVNEPGLYRLIFKSRKAAAGRMKKWIFSVVLPSIRKTGSYSVEELKVLRLSNRQLAVEVSESIVKISNNLHNNPRLAQILIDCAMNDVLDQRQLPAAQEFPEDKWYGLVQIADKLGIKTNASTRTKLGQFVSKHYSLERVRETRLCNGQQTEIWCYRDDELTRDAVKEWASNN